MSNVEKLSVSLSPELAELVRSSVGKGGYTSSSELIREALRDWQVKQAIQEAELLRMRKGVADGLNDLENGRFTEITTQDELDALVDDVRKRGREKLAALSSD